MAATCPIRFIESDFRGYADFPHAYFQALDDTYEHFLSVPDDFIDARAAVLVVAHLDWRGKGSGAQGTDTHRGRVLAESGQSLQGRNVHRPGRGPRSHGAPGIAR